MVLLLIQLIYQVIATINQNNSLYKKTKNFMNRKILITALMISLSIFVSAGDNSNRKTQNNLSVGTGYSNFRVLDRKVTPLIYSSGQIPIIISYDHVTANSIFRAKLNFEYGLLSPLDFKDRSFTNTTSNHNGEIRENNVIFTGSSHFQDELDIEYLRLINSNKGGNFNLYFGGQLKQYFSYSMTQSPIFVFSEVSLNPSLLMSYRISDTFESQTHISIPLASIITQMPYANDPTDGKNNYLISTFLMGSNFASLNRYQRINFHQSFQKKLNQRLSVALDYNFYWFHYKNVSDINAYDNSVSLKLIINLNSAK